MSTLKLQDWMTPTNPVADVEQVVVLKERRDSRAAVQAAIKETVKDHFVGLDILARIGRYKTALDFIRNKLPLYWFNVKWNSLCFEEASREWKGILGWI